MTDSGGHVKRWQEDLHLHALCSVMPNRHSAQCLNRLDKLLSSEFAQDQMDGPEAVVRNVSNTKIA